MVDDLMRGGRWQRGDPKICMASVEELERMRSDRVMRRPVPTTWTQPQQGGQPPRHGKEFRFNKPDTWGDPDAATVQVTDRYGIARAMGWNRICPKLTTRSAWIDHTGELPSRKGVDLRGGGEDAEGEGGKVDLAEDHGRVRLVLDVFRAGGQVLLPRDRTRHCFLQALRADQLSNTCWASGDARRTNQAVWTSFR
uniref:Transposase n=1 Tax=Streptomyces sp. NBC_00093 TaxID=2975649 RepID=A0AAU2A6J2_9ACTN